MIKYYRKELDLMLIFICVILILLAIFSRYVEYSLNNTKNKEYSFHRKKEQNIIN